MPITQGFYLWIHRRPIAWQATTSQSFLKQAIVFIINHKAPLPAKEHKYYPFYFTLPWLPHYLATFLHPSSVIPNTHRAIWLLYKSTALTDEILVLQSLAWLLCKRNPGKVPEIWKASRHKRIWYFCESIMYLELCRGKYKRMKNNVGNLKDMLIRQ